jgi:hypothetical protein
MMLPVCWQSFPARTFVGTQIIRRMLAVTSRMPAIFPVITLMPFARAAFRARVTTVKMPAAHTARFAFRTLFHN